MIKPKWHDRFTIPISAVGTTCCASALLVEGPTIWKSFMGALTLLNAANFITSSRLMKASAMRRADFADYLAALETGKFQWGYAKILLNLFCNPLEQKVGPPVMVGGNVYTDHGPGGDEKVRQAILKAYFTGLARRPPE